MADVRPLRWKEGMFLRPHHLQQQASYSAALWADQLRLLETYGWGVIRLELLEESLLNYVVTVKAFRAVFQDGTLVDVPGGARLPAVTLDPKRMADAGVPVDISVGLRRAEDRRPMSAFADEGEGRARCLTVMDEVYDLDTGRDPVTVERLEYDLRFFVGDEPTHGYDTLRVARLVFTGNNDRPVAMAPGFAPPSMALDATDCLIGAARGVVEMLSLVLREKEEVRGREDQPGELIRFQALSGSLPVLRHMVATGAIHPRWAYLEMVRLAGTLFFRASADRSMDEIPEYDHSDPGPVFGRLRQLIEDLGKGVIKRRWRSVPMSRSQDLFEAGLPSEAKASGVRLLLRVEADLPPTAVANLMQYARVSDPARMEFLTRNILAGIPCDRLVGPPNEIPLSESGVFYLLKTESGNEWTKHVMKGEKLAALLPGAPVSVRLHLVYLLPRE